MATKRTKKVSIVPTFVLPVGTASVVTAGPRTFQQPLATAPATTVGGLEFSLATDFSLFACLEGAVTWAPAAGSSPGRLTITIDGITIRARLRAVQTLEAPVVQIIYENVDPATLQGNFETIITNAYNFTLTKPDDPSLWHASMRQEKLEKKKNTVAHSMLKDRLDALSSDADRSTEITKIVSDFLTNPRPTVQIAVGPGDHLADALGPDHRVVIYMIDSGNQMINPLFYFQLYTHATGKIVFNGTLAGHPLVVAYPEINQSTPPAPRVLIQLPSGDQQDQFVLGPLQQTHGYPGSTSQWQYGPTGLFSVDADPHNPSQAETTRAQKFWQNLGAEVARQAKEVRVPCELAASLFIHESGGDPMNFRFEPLTDKARGTLTSQAAVLVREYDKVVGIPITSITAVKRQPLTTKFGEAPVSRLSIQLSEASLFSAQRLFKSQRKRLLIDEVFRPDMAAIKGSGTAFDFDIKEESFSGHASQGAGAETTPLTTTAARAGRIRALRARVTGKSKLDYAATVTLAVNNNTIVLSIPAGASHAEAPEGAIDVVKGDTVTVKVKTDASTSTAKLEADLEWFLGVVDPGGTVDAFLMVGANPSTTGVNPVPVPWDDSAAVRSGSTLNWGQVGQLLDIETGSFLSPGLSQNLVATALENITRINIYDPTLISRLGITPVTKPSDMIRGTTQQEETAGTPRRLGWLFESVNATFVGLVKMRIGYRDDNSRWDMPFAWRRTITAGTSSPIRGARPACC